MNTGETFAQITLRSASTANDNDFTLDIPRPAGLVAGDLMIASILQSNDENDNLSNDSPPTGWLLVDGREIADRGNDIWWGTIWYKVATAADVAAADFRFTGNVDTEDMVGGIMAFSGVDVTGGFDANGNPGFGPFDVDPGTLGPRIDSDVLNATSISTVSDNAAVVMIGMVTDNRNFSNWNTTSPGALTEIFDIDDNADADLATGSAWGIKPTAGATGAGTADLSGGGDDDSMSMLLALKPIPDGPVSSCGEAIYITPGLQTFFVPDGVTSITVETWGAGGRGSSILSQNSRGAGGGGGAYSRSTISVTPGEPIAVYVGTGSTTDSPGESSWVARTESVSDALVLAVGGDSGPDDSSGRPLGSGGDATAGIGDFRFSGGDGADRGNSRNGGGGSSAGTSSNGNSPTPPNDVNRVFGAVAPLGGGNGGDGGPETGATSNGLSGAQPGGGGGGARRTSSSGTGIGGSGGNGQVIISYTCPSNTPCSRVIDDGAISGTTIIEFTADCTWDAPENLLEFEVLAIGGGGGGGVRSGGGGGGGGAIHARANIDERFNSGLPAGTSFFIEIGNGGLGSTDRDNKGLNGGESIFDSGGDYEIIAGGGGGGGSDDNAAEDGNDGQASSFAMTTGFTIVSGINFNGSGGGGGHDGNGGNGNGDGGNADKHSGAGAGGLSGNDGQNAPNDDDGGDGANGRRFSSFDINLNRFFAAGGGGGSRDNEIGVGGSASSGGDGGIEDKNDATAGGNATTPGSGGGGSGHDEDVIGGNGADGIVFVKYSNIRILPVEYLYFNAKYNSFLRSGDLAWATAKEWENDRFEVERSVNNLTSWERIGVIDGAGYSDGPIDYDYQDLKLPLAGGNIFYRLKQVDLDGEFSFSDTKSIKVEALPGTTQWRIFPNPTSGYPFSIELLDPSAYRDEEVTLRVISPIGQYEFIQVNEVQEMGAQVSKYFEGKSSGVYTLEISWGIHREYHKVILMK